MSRFPPPSFTPKSNLVRELAPEAAGMPRPLDYLSLFRPNGCTSEMSDQHQQPWMCINDEEVRDGGRGYRYFLFPQVLARQKGGGLENWVTEVGDWNHDEEIFIHDKLVVWSGGGHVRKRFSSQFKVMQALWCLLDSMPEPILCMLHSDSVTTCTPSGTMDSIPLEFSATAMWVLPCGLLIERERKYQTPFGEGSAKFSTYSGAMDLYRDSFRDAAPPSPGSKLHTGAYGLWAGSSKKSTLSSTLSPSSVLYVLQHPFDEIQAVQIEDAGKLHVASNPEEQVIWSSSTLSYLACYQKSKMQHSLWQVKVVSNRLGTESIGPPSTQFQRVVLCCLWRDNGQQARATEVFSAADVDGVPVLCLVVREQRQLASLRLVHPLHHNFNTSPKLEVAWTIPALSAVPVAVTRTGFGLKKALQMDILVLAPDGNLLLYVGNSCICQYYLPMASLPDLSQESLGLVEVGFLNLSGSNSGRHPTPQTSNAKVPVISLCDPVYNRVNVRGPTGKKYRCAVTLLPSSAITSACLLALSEALEPAKYHQLLSGLLERELSPYKAVHMSVGGPDGLPDNGWSAFSQFTLEWARNQSKTSFSSPMATKESEEPSHWDFLLQSNIHRINSITMRYPALSMPQVSYSLPHTLVSEDIGASGSILPSVLFEVLEALHVVYEDHKLDSLRSKNILTLATLLCNLASLAGEVDYIDHYTRDFPTALFGLSEAFKLHTKGVKKTPCSLLQWLENRVRGKHHAFSGESLPSLLLKEQVVCVDWSRKVLGFYDIMMGGELSGDNLESGFHMRLAKGSATSSEQRTVLAMVAEGFGLPNLDRLPPGVSIPLRHALERCRETPPDDWPANAYVLIGREDLAATRLARRASVFQSRGSVSQLSTAGSPEEDKMLMAAPYMLHLQPVLVEKSSNDGQEPNQVEPQTSAAIDGHLNDGMEHVFLASLLRFGSDLRLNEVRRLLSSSKPVAISTAISPDLSDPDLVAQQQSQLWQLAQRTTALPFGRGAFTLATLRPLLTEALPIPKLVLAGRLPSQHDATVNLDGNSGNIQDLTSWPEFHNGVAAGLRLAPCQAKITRTWILYNKPDEFNHAHAGVLMALGLHKHLGVLAATDVYRYLAEEHEATTVGLLLGMASAHRGTMDPAISKMLYLHIPARHPPSFPELELPTLMQSAALMAVGLLYQGSAHRLTTEILLAEIGRKPGSDLGLEREGYALAAGLALGLVTLGRGRDAWGLADLCIEDRLKHLMFGGVEPYDERRRKFDGSFTTHTFPTAARSLEDSQGQVMEGSMTNLDVTAPGATLALGLMFLKTNSEEVAARLSIPDTHFALEYVRPDFVLLRVVARSLILWDSTQATEDWVQLQIPSIVKAFLNSDQQAVGVQMPLADADYEALAQAHVNILAGACLSIGLRYAGTASAEAQQLLHSYALYFMKEKRAAAPLGGTSSPDSPRTYVDRNTLETCLNVVILSLSVVMAGTGHLRTFRLLRYLRRRNDTDAAISFGNHMAISMAIGFLFLGGGAITFATNNGAVAALLIALYPRFPTAPNDHRCHLQAFRHLYVLATEARCIQTVDVDSGLPVYVPIEITLKESASHRETTISKITPCLVPERSSLKRVRICGPRYWSQVIELPATADQPWWVSGEMGGPFGEGVLYVKRKVGARSYIDDPIGCRSLLSRAFHKDGGSNAFAVPGSGDGQTLSTSKVDQLISTFSADPSMLAFAQLLCRTSSRTKIADAFQDFCLQSLFECVSTDRPGLLQTYMALYTTVEALVNRLTGRGSSVAYSGNDTVSLYSLKVALAYADAVSQDDMPCFRGESIVQLTFLQALAKRVDEVFSLVRPQESADEIRRSEAMDLARYLKSRAWPGDAPLAIESWESNKRAMIERIMFACYLCWYDVPQPGIVQAAIQHISRFPVDLRRSLMESNGVLPVLASFMAGTSTPALLRINRCLPFLE